MKKGFKLREAFNIGKVKELAESIRLNYTEFDKEGFIQSINFGIDKLSFGDRAKLIAENLKTYLPDDFPKAADILIKSLGPELNVNEETSLKVEELTGYEGFIIMPQTMFVGKYGLYHFDISMKALYEMTKRFSSEGDIRPFIQKYPDKTLKLLSKWTEDQNCHVRRLVSEGTRPRLPLGKRIPEFIDDPSPVIALLDKLRNDPVLYVRRSVANNLNDISKDNPDVVIETLTRWKKDPGIYTNWIVNHALRTLIKQGHPEALSLLGYSPISGIELAYFYFKKHTIHIGEYLSFKFKLINRNAAEQNIQNILIDYIIHYMKANGKRKPKVFKLSKIIIDSNEIIITKKRLFDNFSTRKHYPGEHFLEIVINGQSFIKKSFFLAM